MSPSAPRRTFIYQRNERVRGPVRTIHGRHPDYLVVGVGSDSERAARAAAAARTEDSNGVKRSRDQADEACDVGARLVMIRVVLM